MASAFNAKNFMETAAPEADKRRNNLVFMAHTCEAAERYDDMCKFMKLLVEWSNESKEQLTVEERNLLSVAYKNAIGAHRAAWRTLQVDEYRNNKLAKEYSKQVESELSIVCQEVLDLLKDILVPNAKNNHEASVFYLKMSADYYRYLAEVISEQGHEKKAGEKYEAAFSLAKEQMDATNPIRLGLALNYSVCLYEILKEKERACELAKEAFDEAISKLDKLDEGSYKDSTLIMQLLRDNLTLWTSEKGGGGDIAVQDVSDEEDS